MAGQSSVQNANALYVKDVAVSYATFLTSIASSADVIGASWTDIGALTDVSVDNAIESGMPNALNVEHATYITKERSNIKITLQEISRTNIAQIMNGLVQTENIAGSLVSGYSDVFLSGSWSNSLFIPYRMQNGNLGTITATSITASVGGSLILNTDYVFSKDNNGLKSGFVLLGTGKTSSTAQNITALYNYTPNTTERMYLGGASRANDYMLKFSATMSDGRVFSRYYPRVCYNTGGTVKDQKFDAIDFKDCSFDLLAKQHDGFIFNGRKVLFFWDWN